MSNKIIIHSKDKNILLYSEITKDYPWFYEFLKSNQDEDITEEKVNSLPLDKKNFILNMSKEILKKAKNEWEKANRYENMGDDEENWKRCSLSNTKTKHIFYISNSRNGKELNVGKQCLSRFGDKDDKHIKELIKEAKETKRLEVLEQELPGIKKIIDDWNKSINDYEILIVDHLEKPYKETGRKLKSLLNDYLEERCGKESFERFEKLLTKGKQQIDKIDQYVVKNKNKKYIATPKVIRWLKKQKVDSSKTAISFLKEDGEIKWRSAFRIAEPDFMNSIIYDLNSGFKKENMNLKITKAIPEQKRYIIKYIVHNINLFCNHKKLISKYGYLLFNEKPLVKTGTKDIISMSEISEDSLEQMINKLRKKINNKFIKLDDYNLEFDQITFLEKESKEYIQLNLKNLLEEHKIIILGLENNTNKLIKFICDPNRTRYSKSQIEEFKESREDGSLKSSMDF